MKAPGLQTVMGYLLPKRTDCEVYLNDNIDVTDLLPYLDSLSGRREGLIFSQEVSSHDENI